MRRLYEIVWWSETVVLCSRNNFDQCTFAVTKWMGRHGCFEVAGSYEAEVCVLFFVRLSCNHAGPMYYGLAGARPFSTSSQRPCLIGSNFRSVESHDSSWTFSSDEGCLPSKADTATVYSIRFS